ncbi:CRISPR-associated endonuclease Cas2 [Porphyromonas pogonae]|uniref:CRISPR-associated endonuclease Cas2 n=1 Tax=Porphyromonas pogonae TaxID=867595 RepID=UPI002E762F03|nr:CRISPR-associated endonuclease Cas2 [Porphyromonas pogonae]
MYVLVAYDVAFSEDGQKRLRKVAKVCQNYGHRVQNSLFECLLEPAQFLLMKNDIQNIIDPSLDSVRFYHLPNNYKQRIESLGKSNSLDFTGDLII